MPLAIERADARWRQVRGLAAAATKAHGLALPKRAAAKAATLLLTNNAAMKRLNRQWRGKDKPTNVLSFPAAPGPRGHRQALGDIALAYENCAAEAKAQGKSLKHHALHLIVHGLLHLVGHDHGNAAEAGKMEAREKRVLRHLGIADPYVLEEPNV